jgi:hypothetical protein
MALAQDFRRCVGKGLPMAILFDKGKSEIAVAALDLPAELSRCRKTLQLIS